VCLFPITYSTRPVVASIGAFVPVLFGKETVGQLETPSRGVPGMPDKVIARAFASRIVYDAAIYPCVA
jgi:hypothetical protein